MWDAVDGGGHHLPLKRRIPAGGPQACESSPRFFRSSGRAPVNDANLGKFEGTVLSVFGLRHQKHMALLSATDENNRELLS